MPYFNFFVSLMLMISTALHAAEIHGRADIIDGDTLKIWQQSIRLVGIDAPELNQNCRLANNQIWRCGEVSSMQLKALLLNKSVRCQGKQRDKYQRLLATCYVDSTNINEWLVLKGLAVAYTRYENTYVEAQSIAKEQKKGIWQGDFVLPETFRAKSWLAASEVKKEGCVIKGNINRKGEKIYHAPWSKSYHRTKINTNKGERWFCDENEAISAGWRAPYQ